MRARWLKPEFFRDRKIGPLGPTTALVYQVLWIVADDGGTAPCDTDRLKAEMFLLWPDVTVEVIEQALAALESVKRIRRYKAGDDTYARIDNFPKHQKVHNPSKFRYPQLGEAVTPNTAAALPQSSGSTHILDSQIARHLDSQIATAAGASVGYVTTCTIALNRGLSRNPALGQSWREVAASTQAGRVTWEADGVPAEVAARVVEEKATAYKPNGRNKQPHSLLYFDGAVREEWERIRAHGVTSAADVPGAIDARDAAWGRKHGYG